MYFKIRNIIVNILFNRFLIKKTPLTCVLWKLLVPRLNGREDLVLALPWYHYILFLISFSSYAHHDIVAYNP